VTVVLAYSGGLDTSIILHWIKETYNAEVIAYTGNVGQIDENMDEVREAALATGASEAIVEDLREALVTECVFPAL
jgi:argininosuccinate synthase